MSKPQNKNTVVLIISAVLIVIAIIVAIVATASSGKSSGKNDSTEQHSLDTDLIASLRESSTSSSTNAASATKSKTDKNSNSSVAYETGKYKVATKDDPLGLRLEPNTSSDRIIYIEKGEEVEVLAVWEDWGYVVYEKTGGWLSMNYLELVSGNSSKGQ